MKKLEKNRHMRDGLQLSAAKLTQWRCPVASTKTLDLLHLAMRMVLYQGITAAIKMASKAGPFLHHHFVCCCPGGRWGNTGQVVAQWRRPVASRVALDMLHRAMPSVLLWCTAVAIKNGQQRRYI
jgi:hypothetical protein